MSRDGSGVYSLPAGYEATTGEVATATQHNTPLTDIEADMNVARPVVAGGTGASTDSDARVNLEIDAKVLSKSGAFTAVLGTRSKLIKTTATMTLSLTAAATLGNGWYVDVLVDTGVLTIDPSGAETIDSASTLDLAIGRTCRIRCDGTEFTTQFLTEPTGKGADVASASALTLIDDGVAYDVTGTTDIDTIVGAEIGDTITLKFEDSLTLNHSSSLVLPLQKSIAVVVRDVAVLYKTAASVWRLVSFSNPRSVGVYKSGQQTITSAGLLTLAHGFNIRPEDIRFTLECTTAEKGYSIGDFVTASVVNSTADTTGGTQDRFNGVYSDTTNVYIRFSDEASVFTVGDKATGAVSSLTNSSWSLHVTARE